MIPVMIVVKLESKIAEKAFLYPSSVLYEVFCLQQVPLLRSLISTFASTAIARDKIIPAIPGSVRTSLNAGAASVKKKFNSSAPLITIPE